jgi:hypothetical protein
MGAASRDDVGALAACPSRLQVEATSHCQLACPSCPTATRATEAALGRGLLRPADFAALLDANPGVRKVELSNYGEALLHPRLTELLEIAQQRGVEVTLENGVNFNQAPGDVLEALVRTGVSKITVSIDGASAETYAQYRRGGDFRQVMANLLKLVALKRRLGSARPALTWQFILFSHNAHEVGRARGLAARLGMRFVLKRSWDASRAAPGASRADHLEATGEAYLHTICRQLWRSPQINWNGDVLGCCRNYWGRFGGNAFRDGLGAALNTEGLRAARRALMGEEPMPDTSPCATCDIYLWRRQAARWIEPTEDLASA